MLENRIKLARILVTIPALIVAFVPPVADLNATHVTNPLASLKQLGGLFAGLLSSVAAIQFVWFAWGMVLSIALVRSARAG